MDGNNTRAWYVTEAYASLRKTATSTLNFGFWRYAVSREGASDNATPPSMEDVLFKFSMAPFTAILMHSEPFQW